MKKRRRQVPDSEGFPSKRGPAARPRHKMMRNSFQMKDFPTAHSLARPAGQGLELIKAAGSGPEAGDSYAIPPLKPWASLCLVCFHV